LEKKIKSKGSPGLELKEGNLSGRKTLRSTWEEKKGENGVLRGARKIEEEAFRKVTGREKKTDRRYLA